MTRNKYIFLIILSFCFSLEVLGQVNLQQGLVAYYPFNGNANDESGNRNHGTVYGATLTADRFGNAECAYYFDGENDYIEISDNASLRPQYLSISAWAYTESSKGTLLGKSVYSNAANEQYALGADHFYFNIKRNSACQPGYGWNWVGNSGYSLYNWYHVIGTYDGFMMKIFVNGLLVATNTNTQGPIDGCEGGNLRIGKWWASDPLIFKGKLDDIRIYNRALNQDEVTALYDEGLYSGEITITQVSQHSDGSGIVDVLFDLSGIANLYSISLEASFDGGATYSPIPGSFLSGDIGPIGPGNSKHIGWDGVGSFPNFYSTQAKIKIIATKVGIGQPCPGIPTFIDSRDGKVYNTVQIGNQCWMKENLNYETGNSWCYENNPANCNIYGKLYDWNSAMSACPSGWHLPSDAEWTVLTDYVSSQTAYRCNSNVINIAKSLAAITNWNTSTNTCAIGNNLSANNATGFSGLPGGCRNSDGSFRYLSGTSLWWSSSHDYALLAKEWRLEGDYADVSNYWDGKFNGYSVRCIKDN